VSRNTTPWGEAPRKGHQEARFSRRSVNFSAKINPITLLLVHISARKLRCLRNMRLVCIRHASVYMTTMRLHATNASHATKINERERERERESVNKFPLLLRATVNGYCFPKLGGARLRGASYEQVIVIRANKGK
jgi:hypothetical protein